MQHGRHIERVPDAVYSDAGDILPTFVSPADARRYIDEVDAGYVRLDGPVQASTVAADFKASWTIQFSAWRVFAASAKPSVGWLTTKAVMEQTDRFQTQLQNWYGAFVKAGGAPTGHPPPDPGQGVPGTGTITPGNLTALLVAAGGVAALFMFGPSLARAFK